MSATASAADRPDQRQRPASLRRRLFHHYLPLAAGTVAALAVLVSVPFFDVNRYPPPDPIFTTGLKGAWPTSDYPPTGTRADGADHQRPTGSQGDHGGGPPTTAAPSGDHTGPPAGGHSGPAGGTGSEPEAGAEESQHAGDLDDVLRMRRLSTMTGYLALGLIAATLLIGPANLMLGRRQPVSSYLRRDIGIWASAVSVIHVVFGFLVKHGDGQVLGYFLESADRSRILTNAFGLANWAGLIAIVIALILAAISSDAALRKLKAKRWKRVQRWNYALAVLTVAHAVLYGALWRLTSPYTLTLLASMTGVVICQLVGVRLWRRRRLAPAET